MNDFSNTFIRVEDEEEPPIKTGSFLVKFKIQLILNGTTFFNFL